MKAQQPNLPAGVDSFTKRLVARLTDILRQYSHLINTVGTAKHNPVWKDNLIPFFSAKVPGSSAPDLVNIRDGLYAYAFDDGTDEEVYMAFHIDHDYDPGSVFYPHVHWTPGNSTETGTVRWGFEYSMAARDTGAFGASTTIYLEQAGAGTAYTHQVVEASSGVTPPTPEVDSVILVRVFRDANHANDTFTGDAFGLFVDLHYQASYIGTLQKAADFYAE